MVIILTYAQMMSGVVAGSVLKCQMGRYQQPDSANLKRLHLPFLSLLVGTETLLEQYLFFKLQILPAQPELEERSFNSMVPSQEVEASETVDLGGYLGFFGAGFLR